MPLLCPRLRLEEPCGRFSQHAQWSRTRENSLSLKDLEFWLVWRGEGWMSDGEQRISLGPGFCALMRPGGIYDAGQSETNPLGVTYLHFTPERGSWKIAEQWPEFFLLTDLEYADQVSRRILELRIKQPETAALLLQGLVSDLLQRAPLGQAALSHAGYHSSRLTQLIAETYSMSPDQLPDVRDMAKRMNLSPEHFSRLFKSHTGETPKEFLLRIRISHARHLLRETNLTNAQIAERLGYSDLFFFSKQFKQKTGSTPGAYRGR